MAWNSISVVALFGVTGKTWTFPPWFGNFLVITRKWRFATAAKNINVLQIKFRNLSLTLNSRRTIIDICVNSNKFWRFLWKRTRLQGFRRSLTQVVHTRCGRLMVDNVDETTKLGIQSTYVSWSSWRIRHLNYSCTNPTKTMTTRLLTKLWTCNFCGECKTTKGCVIQELWLKLYMAFINQSTLMMLWWDCTNSSHCANSLQP